MNTFRTAVISRGAVQCMRISRGARGWGWYTKYKREGNSGFIRNKPPTPFTWDRNPESGARRQIYFDIELGGESAGRIEFELASDILPLTTTNFVKLCEGTTESDGEFLSYKGTNIHALVKGVGLMGGDVERKGGMSSHSAYGKRFFRDEGFFIPHSCEGLLTMANNGIDTNGSQFYITVAPAPHLDGRSVAFGRVISGMPLVHQIFSLFSIRSKPVTEILISDCNVIQ